MRYSLWMFLILFVVSITYANSKHAATAALHGPERSPPERAKHESEDGALLFVFDGSGRHIYTKDGITGATMYHFQYDVNGYLLSITDRDNNVTRFTPPASTGAITPPFGGPTGLIFGAALSNTSTDPGALLLTHVIPPYRASFGFVSFRYDSATGLMAEADDPKGQPTKYAYSADGLGLLVEMWNPIAGGIDVTFDRQMQRDTGGNLFTDHVGFTVITTTAEGQITKALIETLQDGSAQRTIVAADGATTVSRTFSDSSNLTTSADGTVTRSTVGADPRFGMLAPVGASSAMTLSGLSSYTSADGGAVFAATMIDQTELRSVELDDGGAISAFIETSQIGGAPPSVTHWDATSHTWTTTSPAGRTVTSTVDAIGHVIRTSVPGVVPTLYSYDAFGRLVSAMQSGNDGGIRSLTVTYDSSGRVQGLSYDGGVPGEGVLAAAVEYAAGLPVSITQPGQEPLNMTFDDNANIISISPPGRHPYSVSYLPSDLESSFVPPFVDGGGTGINYTYDRDLRLKDVSAEGQGTTVYYYSIDGGQLSTVTSPIGITTFEYDATTHALAGVSNADSHVAWKQVSGLLISVSATCDEPAVAGTLSYTYDARMRVQSESLSSGVSIDYQYDDDNLPTNIGAMQLSWDPENGLYRGSSLGAVQEVVTPEEFGTVSSISYVASSAPLFSQQYIYDSLGRIKSIKSLSETRTFAYDVAGRLSDVYDGAGAQLSHYSHDANGNRLAAPGLMSPPVYDDQDRLLSYGVYTYSYRPNGELLTRTDNTDVSNPQTAVFDYDAVGNLRGVNLADGTPVSYVIDALNRRIGTKVNGKLIEGFVYRNQLQPAIWLNPDGSARATFVYGARSHVPEYMIMGNVTYRFLTDQVGSVRVVVNTSTGEQVEIVEYDEYGNVMSDSAPGFQPFGFVGGLADHASSLGFVRFGARDYDPKTGRWVTKDPLLFGGGSSNMYVYASNDPINHMDPSGLTIEVNDSLKGVFNVVQNMPGLREKIAQMEDSSTIIHVDPKHQTDEEKIAENAYGEDDLGLTRPRLSPNGTCMSIQVDIFVDKPGMGAGQPVLAETVAHELGHAYAFSVMDLSALSASGRLRVNYSVANDWENVARAQYSAPSSYWHNQPTRPAGR